ncbi:MAG: hypothetical protein SFU91_04150 [Chloroherpetonaceae bacterium]|nr:hypothetical protein [Chloroherpetonaceae bacterium]
MDNNKIKLLSALMWLLAAWELLNALGSTVFLNLGASLYGWSGYLDSPLTVNVFHQYGMVMYVLAVGYAIIATDVVKYEKLMWMVVIEQIVGAIVSTYEVLNAEQIISWSNFALVHTPQGIILALLWFLRPSYGTNISGKISPAA